MSEEKAETEMTPEERLAWLRERGVQVTTPEELRAGQTAPETTGTNQTTKVSFVYLPADTSKPMEERTVVIPADYAGDFLVHHLKASIGGDGNHKNKVDISLLQQQAQQTLAASPDTPSSVSDETLKQVAQTASVETFTLVHPTPSNQFTGIQMYLDEVGVLKRLPLNHRASDYAQRAGFDPPPNIHGDVFLGRVQKKPSLRNLPFHLGADTAPDAPWLIKATTENLEYQTAMNEMTGRGNDTRQPTVAGSDGNAKQEDGFRWTQTEEEVEVSVPIPSTCKSKDLQVKFKPRELQVTVHKELKVKIRLFEHVDVDGCTWTIERSAADGAANLVITMEKADAALWSRIID